MLRCSGAKVRGVILKCVTGLKGTSTPMCNLRLLHVCKVEMDPQLVTFCVVCWLYLVGRDFSGGDIHSETPVFKWSSESQGEKENYDKKKNMCLTSKSLDSRLVPHLLYSRPFSTTIQDYVFARLKTFISIGVGTYGFNLPPKKKKKTKKRDQP